MNRPKLDDEKYEYVDFEYSIDNWNVGVNYKSYAEDLDKYCDHQEETIRSLVKRDYDNMQYRGKMGEEILKLRSALYNACHMLSEVTTCPMDKMDCDIGCEHKCNSELSMDYTECWKEYILKEIENETL